MPCSKLALLASAGLLSYWYIVVPAVLGVLATWLPGIRKLREVPFVGGLVFLVRSLLSLLIVMAFAAGLIYTWWIWVVLVVAMIVLSRATIASRRIRRRGAIKAVARSTLLRWDIGVEG